jgi:hypothetical protein
MGRPGSAEGGGGASTGGPAGEQRLVFEWIAQHGDMDVTANLATQKAVYSSSPAAAIEGCATFRSRPYCCDLTPGTLGCAADARGLIPHERVGKRIRDKVFQARLAHMVGGGECRCDSWVMSSLAAASQEGFAIRLTECSAARAKRKAPVTPARQGVPAKSA